MVIDDATKRVLGVSLVMRDVGESSTKRRWESGWARWSTNFVDVLHVYPTMAVALKIVAISRNEGLWKLSCWAE